MARIRMQNAQNLTMELFHSFPVSHRKRHKKLVEIILLIYLPPNIFAILFTD